MVYAGHTLFTKSKRSKVKSKANTKQRYKRQAQYFFHSYCFIQQKKDYTDERDRDKKKEKYMYKNFFICSNLLFKLKIPLHLSGQSHGRMALCMYVIHLINYSFGNLLIFSWQYL